LTSGKSNASAFVNLPKCNPHRQVSVAYLKNYAMKKRLAFCLLIMVSLLLKLHAQDNYSEITLPELMKKKRQGDKNMVIVDVRSPGEYYDSITWGRQSNIGRIKDAINIPVQEFSRNPEAVKQQLAQYKNKDIYLICSHSYRSRVASNVLLNNGFTHVNNVRGGMTEWYRRYEDLYPYRSAFLEKSVSYKNMSPAQLYDELSSGKDVLLIGLRNTPRFWWDSANVRYFQYFPMLKNAVYLTYADSLQVFELAKKDKSRPVVLFNIINNGAAELANRLTQLGVTDVSYLVGGLNLFYESLRNRKTTSDVSKLISIQSPVDFITPENYCKIASKPQYQLVDIRHDSLFNKPSRGVKHTFSHLKNAVNFYEKNGPDLFMQQYPDKKKDYVLISQNGTDGIEFANSVAQKGYKIHWLINGIDRWEWYMNNVEDFGCNNLLVE
jgi:rhodanese-related sulfurtransferase